MAKSQLQKTLEQNQFTSAALYELTTSIKKLFPDTISVELYACYGECRTVLVLIVSEEMCRDFVTHTQKLLQCPDWNHLFPAQVRFAALGELCSGSKELQSNFFQQPRSSHFFADVLFLPSDWRERTHEFSVAYYSSTPEHVSQLLNKIPLTQA